MQPLLFLGYAMVSMAVGYRAHCLVCCRRRITKPQKVFTVVYWSSVAAATQMMLHFGIYH